MGTQVQKALAKAEAEQSIDEMFATETAPGIMDTMAELAEVIAVEDEKCKRLDTELKERKEQLGNIKQQLHELMMANNCAEGHKFDNGLFVKPYVKVDVWRAGGVTDEMLFAWLRDNKLDSIIKETVNVKTLSATMKIEMSLGRNLPEIFNVACKPTTQFAGKGTASFLAAKQIV